MSVHDTSDRFLSDCTAGPKLCLFSLQVLHVVIDGKKYELQADATKQGLLPLGEYKALQAKQKDGLTVYEFLLPDNKTERFTVVGQSE